MPSLPAAASSSLLWLPNRCLGRKVPKLSLNVVPLRGLWDPRLVGRVIVRHLAELEGARLSLLYACLFCLFCNLSLLVEAALCDWAGSSPTGWERWNGRAWQLGELFINIQAPCIIHKYSSICPSASPNNVCISECMCPEWQQHERIQQKLQHAVHSMQASSQR